MDWNEYINRQGDKYRDYKQALCDEQAEQIRAIKYLPSYEKALTLKDLYMSNAGYLANGSELLYYIKTNLYPSTALITDQQIIELHQIINVILVDPLFYLPSYLDIYNAKTGNPYSQAEIIQRYIDGLDEEFEREPPESLLGELEYDQLKDIWDNYLDAEHRSHIKSLSNDQQRSELLKLVGSYAEYAQLKNAAESLKSEYVLLWISESLEKYIQTYLHSQIFTDEILDEIDIINDIKDRLTTLLNTELNFDAPYLLLHQKYLDAMNIRRGQQILRRRDWFKSQRWENCFPEKILAKLLADEQLVKLIAEMTKAISPKDYWNAKQSLLDSLENFNLPPLRRHLS